MGQWDWNLGLRVDRYLTEEEPFQTESKVNKFCRSKLHCVASVYIVGQSLTWVYIWVSQWLWISYGRTRDQTWILWWSILWIAVVVNPLDNGYLTIYGQLLFFCLIEDWTRVWNEDSDSGDTVRTHICTAFWMNETRLVASSSWNYERLTTYPIPKLIPESIAALQCWHLSAQDPHPVHAQKSEQNHGFLPMIYFNKGSHWSIHPFLSPWSVSKWCR